MYEARSAKKQKKKNTCRFRENRGAGKHHVWGEHGVTIIYTYTHVLYTNNNNNNNNNNYNNVISGRVIPRRCYFIASVFSAAAYVVITSNRSGETRATVPTGGIYGGTAASGSHDGRNIYISWQRPSGARRSEQIGPNGSTRATCHGASLLFLRSSP